MLRCKLSFFVAIFMGLALAGSSPPARADFTLSISDGKETVTFDWNTQTVTISGTGTTNAVNGSFASQGGGFTVSQLAPLPGFTQSMGIVGLQLDGLSILASASNSASPGPPAMISLGGIFISNNTSSKRTLTFNEQSTGFTLPTGSLQAITEGNMIASSSVTATYKTQVNGANVDGGLSLPGGNSPVITPIGPLSAGYTVGGVLAISLPASTGVTDVSTSSTIATPEPSSITLLGLGAVSLVGYCWRRRKVTIA
jgi:hypothetical protein